MTKHGMDIGSALIEVADAVREHRIELDNEGLHALGICIQQGCEDIARAINNLSESLREANGLDP